MASKENVDEKSDDSVKIVANLGDVGHTMSSGSGSFEYESQPKKKKIKKIY